MWFIHSRFHRLVKAKLNGIITPDQEAHLDRILQESAAKRAEYTRLHELKAQLDTLNLEDEAIDISNQVMQRITSKSAAEKTSTLSPGYVERLFNPLAFRFAIAVFAGLILGSAFTWVMITERDNSAPELLSGSLSSAPKQSISFSRQYNTIKVVPYRVGDLHFINFLIEAQDEMVFEVTFLNTEVSVTKADYISAGDSRSIQLDIGRLKFSAKGRTSFQLILEKTATLPALIMVTARQNQSVLINQQLSLE